MDSFYQTPHPECCNPFPGVNLKFCWEVDSNYCGTCGRWTEGPYEHIPREERHTKDCPNPQCFSIPKSCLCGHSDKQHHKSMLLRDLMHKSDEEFEKLVSRMWSGPHNCTQCNCKNWTPDPNGPGY